MYPYIGPVNDSLPALAVTRHKRVQSVDSDFIACKAGLVGFRPLWLQPRPWELGEGNSTEKIDE